MTNEEKREALLIRLRTVIRCLEGTHICVENGSQPWPYAFDDLQDDLASLAKIVEEWGGL